MSRNEAFALDFDLDLIPRFLFGPVVNPFDAELLPVRVGPVKARRARLSFFEIVIALHVHGLTRTRSATAG